MGFIVKTSPPKEFTDHEINEFGDWYTWSDSFRDTLKALNGRINDLPTPRLIKLYSQKHYGLTYTLVDPNDEDEIHQEILTATKELLELRLSARLLLFQGMIDESISEKTIHYLLSCFHYFVGQLLRDPGSAMYAPLGSTSDKGFDFPLHTDLYRQKLLMILFNRVAEDDTGLSLLISVERFESILHGLEKMPDNVRKTLSRLISKNDAKDHFNVFFELLYRRNAPWKNELKKAFGENQISIKFNKGEGYLLNDRKWLHGRTAPSNGVFHNRLYRIAFNSFETQ